MARRFCQRIPSAECACGKSRLPPIRPTRPIRNLPADRLQNQERIKMIHPSSFIRFLFSLRRCCLSVLCVLAPFLTAASLQARENAVENAAKRADEKAATLMEDVLH